jgi:hypothetical protein
MPVVRGNEEPARPSMLVGAWVRTRLHSLLFALSLALAAPLVASTVMISVRSHVANTSLALIMVAVVVAAVVPGRRVAAVVAGISAGVWFDFFLTKPYESFAVNRSADRETTILLIVVAVAVGEIAVRSRRHHATTVSARTDLVGIARLTETLAGGAGAEEIIETVRVELILILSLEGCRFDATTTAAVPPYLDRRGLVMYNRFSRDAAHEGLPNAEVSLPVTAGDHQVGRFVLRGPALGVPIGVDALLTAVVLADLAGVALTSASPDLRLLAHRSN